MSHNSAEFDLVVFPDGRRNEPVIEGRRDGAVARQPIIRSNSHAISARSRQVAEAARTRSIRISQERERNRRGN